MPTPLHRPIPITEQAVSSRYTVLPVVAKVLAEIGP